VLADYRAPVWSCVARRFEQSAETQTHIARPTRIGLFDINYPIIPFFERAVWA
jgi:hypothetical protein